MQSYDNCMDIAKLLLQAEYLLSNSQVKTAETALNIQTYVYKSPSAVNYMLSEYGSGFYSKSYGNRSEIPYRSRS